jgi:sec-independent protein translocase protein TatC
MDELPEKTPAPVESGFRAEMPFLEHLEELRWRILKSLAAVLVGAGICLFFSTELLQVLTRPYEQAVLAVESGRSTDLVEMAAAMVREWIGQPPPASAPSDTTASPAPAPASVPTSRRLQALKPMTYFILSLQIGLWGGVALALPVVLYQLWRFVAPGLLTRERRLVFPVIGLSVACFALGAFVAYAMVLPLGLRFFLSLEPPQMTSQWAVDEYISFVLYLVMGFGIVFELPVVALFLARLGLINAGHLRRVRRYAIVVIFVVAAILTPPDPLSQMMMAIPLLFLYEVSIWICAVAAPRRRRDKSPTG